MQNKIQLVYEGPEDASPDTLRKIKSTFVAELNYSIDETRKFIEETPCVVISSIDEDLVQKMFDCLQAAGAKVLMVKPDMGSDEFENQALLEEPVLVKKTVRAEEPETPYDDEPQTFEIELDLTAPVEAPPSSKKVYDLNEEPEAKTAPEEEKPPVKKKEQEPMFSFEEISKALEDSQKIEEKPVLKSSLVEEPVEEFDLSFDDEPAPSRKETTPEIKETREVRKAGTSSDTADLPEIVMEAEGPALEQTVPETAPQQPATGTEDEHEETAEQAQRGSVPKLSDLAARRAPLPPHDSAESDTSVVQSTDDSVQGYREPREKPLWREIGVPVAVLGALMGAGTWYYFNYLAPAPPATAVPVKAERVSAAPAPAETAAPLPTATPVPSNRMKGRADLPDRSISAEIVLDGEAIKSIRAEISTMPPPPLTPEQIVRGEKRKPWLKRIEIEDSILTFDNQSQFSGNSPAKAYIDNDKQGSSRVIATAAVSGTRVSRNEIALHVEVFYNTGDNPIADQEIIRKAADGGFAFSVSGDVILSR